MKKKILAGLISVSMLLNSFITPLYAEEVVEEDVVEDEVSDAESEMGNEGQQDNDADFEERNIASEEAEIDSNAEEEYEESLVFDPEECGIDGHGTEAMPLPALTGNQRLDAAEIAASQVGNRETGTNVNAYGPAKDWCVYFASWAALTATDNDESIWPFMGSTNGLIKWFQNDEYAGWHNSVDYVWSNSITSGGGYDEGYIPQPGDFVAIENYVDSEALGPGHTGIVYRVDAANDDLETIEGNIRNQVVKKSYHLSDRTEYAVDYGDGWESSTTHYKFVGFGVPAYDDNVNVDTEHDAVICIESITSGVQDVTVTGWAYDPDDKGGSVEVQVWVDDEGHSIGQTDVYRSDVNEAFGLVGNHGFSKTVSTERTGAVKVSIHAVNLGPGHWASDSRYLIIQSRDEYSELHSAKICIDSSAGGVRQVSVSGWAYDPDDKGASMEIQAWIDGVGYGLGKTNIYRSDVNEAFGLSGNHGFDFTFETDQIGSRKVDIVAVNIGQGYWGSATENLIITDNKKPVGNFESASGGNRIISIEGWAYDPDEPTKEVVIHAYVGGDVNDSNADGYNLGSTNIERSDVNSAHGLTGKHGFEFTINTGRSGSIPIYLYALDTRYPDPLYLGSKTVTVTQTVPVTGVKIDDTEHYINGMYTGQPITAHVTPSNATNQKITWRSSDTSIATVTSTGDTSAYVERKDWGEVTIYASITDNGKTYEDSCKFILAEDKYLYGDITGDGKISISDLTTCNSIINKISSSGYQPDNNEIRTLDLDGDGDIDTDDRDLLNQRINGTISSFPVESMLNKIIIESPPEKTEYFKGDNVSTSGLKIRAYYNNGTSKIVTPTRISGSNSSIVGDNTVTVEYTESERTRSATYVLRIKSVDLTSISITTPPTKTLYTVGESFDKSGMVVRASYNNGSSKIVSDYTFSPSGVLNTSDTKVTIIYKEGSINKEATQNITVRSYCDVNGHDWGEYISDSDSTHYRVCRMCAKKVTSSCIFNSTHVDADCINSGYIQMTCPDCGNTKKSELATEPKLGHNYIVSGFIWSKNGSGYDCNVNLVCDRCNSLTVGHTKADKATVTSRQEDSTCIKQGTIVYTATYGSSKNTKTVALPFAEHQYHWVIDEDATDHEDGVKHEECIVCGNKRNENTVIPRLMADLARIEMATKPSKIDYYLGDVISTAGMKVRAYYEDNTSREITPTRITPDKAADTGTQTITVSYTEGKITRQTSFEINVSEVYVTKISVVGAPTKTAYVDGEYFSKSGMVVQATYNNGTTKNVTNYTVSPSEKLVVSDNSIKVTYVENGHTCETSYPISVADYCETYGHNFKWIIDEVSTETADGKKHEECSRCGEKRNENTVIPKGGKNSVLSRIAVSTLPAKKEYFSGEDILLSGIKVMAYYEDDTSREVTPTIISSAKAEDVGVQIVYLSYTEDEITKTTSFSITVKQIFIERLDVINIPNKTSYVEGESFDKTGMVVRATYNNGLIKNVTDYTISPAGALEKTDNTVKIIYTAGNQSVETTQAITVSDYCDYYGHNYHWVTDAEATAEQTGIKHEECSKCGETRNAGTIVPKLEKNKTLDRILVMKMPNKLDYFLGEEIDLSGLRIMAFYDNDTSREITDIYADKDKADKEGTQPVTVSYTEGGITKTADFSIMVSGVYVEKIEVVGIPDKVFYVEGEKFDKTGMVVRATFSDGTYNTVSECTIQPSGPLSTSDKLIKISYVYDGRIAETTQEIRVNAYCNVYGHDYHWVTDEEATEDKTGVKHEECSHCRTIRSEGTVIPKKDVTGSSSGNESVDDKNDSSSSGEKDDSSSSGKIDNSSSIKDEGTSSSAKDEESSSKNNDASSSTEKDNSSSSDNKNEDSSSAEKDYDTSSSEKDDDNSSSEKDNSSSSTVSEDGLRIRAEKAADEGKGAVDDTGTIIQAGNMGVITGIEDGAVVTVAKGNKLSLQGDEQSFNSADKSLVSVNKKGIVKAKKLSAEPVKISFMKNGKQVSIGIRVVEPSLSGKALIKKLTATSATGSELDVILECPLNIVKGSIANNGAVSELSLSIGEDGKWHLTGKCMAKGTVKVPITINGKKFTYKIKVK